MRERKIVFILVYETVTDFEFQASGKNRKANSWTLLLDFVSTLTSQGTGLQLECSVSR